MKAVTNRRLEISGAMVTLLLAAAHAGAQDAAELVRCSTIENASERLACYDAASSAKNEPPPGPQPEPVPAAPDVPPADDTAPQDPVPVLTDDVGEEQLDREGLREEERMVVRGTVTDCERDASGRHFFYFDNGQVWKQKDAGRLPIRDCSFDVRIERDFFGYKMRIDGQGKDIRISRVR